MRRVHGERSALLGLVLRGRAPVSRAQAQADAGAASMGADVAMTVQDSTRNASTAEAEPPRAKAAPPGQEGPAATADGQQESTARPEGRKRDRSKTGRERGEDGGQAWEKAEFAV